MGEREGDMQGDMCLLRARPFFLTPVYFLAPAMQAISWSKFSSVMFEMHDLTLELVFLFPLWPLCDFLFFLLLVSPLVSFVLSMLCLEFTSFEQDFLGMFS